jgi:AhpD family alkylhydroperoxidase
MGFTPNDVLTMARWPPLLDAMQRLVQVIYQPGELDPLLKRMIATVVSGAAGCRYCQAHTAHGAVKMAGADAAKIAAVWSYQTNENFTEAERAALDLALAAGQQPNAVTDDHFRVLEK